MKNITVGYLRLNKDKFINIQIITKDFLDALSNYVKVVTITTDYRKINLRKLEDLDIDYLLIEIKNFGPMQFILREKQKVNIPFIIILHTIYPWLQSYIYILRLIRKEDIIIAPSQYAKESFLRISDKFDIRVIQHSLDIKYIQGNALHNFKEHDNRMITFMGRLTEEKGIETLIKCMPEIISKVNNVHLNIIGPLSGDRVTDSPKDTFVKRLEREVRNLGLANNVHFTGLKLGWEKYRILSESDIFVNPTTTEEENFPMVNIEALACSVPIIATNWAGNKEIIEDGKNGYLVGVDYDRNKKPKVDAKQLISLIVRVLKNRKLNLKLKENAMETARKFDYRKVMPKLIKLLKKRTRVKIKNRWELIKHKRVTDFDYLFNKDFIFFLYYLHRFNTETYVQLYKRISKLIPLGNKYYSKRTRIKMESTKDIEVMRKIRHNLLDFLLLKYD